jgi:WD40 repeat protein
VKYHDGFILDICPMVSGLGFFSGGRDNKIIMLDLEGNPLQEFIMHQGAVNSLSQAFEHEIVSGSWDGTAIVWDVETGRPKEILKGHTHATSVLTL